MDQKWQKMVQTWLNFGQKTSCVSVLPTTVGKVPTIDWNGYRGTYFGQQDLILALFGHFSFILNHLKTFYGQINAIFTLFCPKTSLLSNKKITEQVLKIHQGTLTLYYQFLNQFKVNTLNLQSWFDHCTMHI